MSKVEFVALDSPTLTELLKDNDGPVEAVHTGFPTWDYVCREEGGRQGLALGWYVVLGGATGKGKTAVVLNMLAAAVKQGHSVGLVNFEMSMRQLAGRYVAIASGMDKKRIEPGEHFDLSVAQDAAARAGSGETHLYTNRKPIISLDELRDSIAALREAGCKMIAVDYLQLIDVPGVHGDYEQTKIVSNVLRQTVHQSGEYVGVALSQLRTEAGRQDKPPTEYDLFGGGKWSHDADQVVMIDHTAHENHEADPFTGFGRIVVAKNRHGPPGEFPIRWDWKTLRCSELDTKHKERGATVAGPGQGASASGVPVPF